jgi:hypothetical protein
MLIKSDWQTDIFALLYNYLHLNNYRPNQNITCVRSGYDSRFQQAKKTVVILWAAQ